MELYDNTMIVTARRCLREYYLRHIRHWKPKGTALPLVFGLGWHEGMDVVWGLADSSRSNSEITQLAMLKFLQTWKEEGLPEELDFAQEEDFSPRTPGIALAMFAEYQVQRREMISKFEIIDIEKPFAVPLYHDRDDIFYVGRRDKVFRSNGRIIFGEHKTTTLYGKATGFRNEFMDSFSPNSQIDGYLHSGHMEYGEEIKGVWVDAALVHKNVHDKFKFIPVDRVTSMLDGWLADTKNWIGIIQDQTKKLEHAMVGPGVGYMSVFPKNTDSCYRYNKPCPYKDFCRSCTDPSRREIPDGYVEEKWEPFDLLKLDQIGMHKDGE